MNKIFRPFILLACILSTGVVATEHVIHRTADTTEAVVLPHNRTVAQLKVQVEDNDNPWVDSLAMRLIPFGVGDEIDVRTLRLAVDNLKLSKSFRDITIDTLARSGEQHIVISMKPAILIEDILIHKAFPLFKSDILNQLSVSIGSVYHPRLIADQKELIKAFCKRRGYPNAFIDIQSVVGRNRNTRKLQIRLHKGKALKVVSIDIRGHSKIKEWAIKRRLSLWRRMVLSGGSARLDEGRLVQDIRTIETFFIQQRRPFLFFGNKSGFQDFEIKYTIEPLEETHRVRLKLQIHEGYRFQLAYQNVSWVQKGGLNKKTGYGSRGRTSASAHRQSLRNIKTHFEKKGFNGIKLSTTSDTLLSKKNGIVQSIVIDKGLQTKVKAIRFFGNDHIHSDALSQQVLSRPKWGIIHYGYCPQQISETLLALQTVYIKLGFLNCYIRDSVIISPDSSEAEVLFNINEGKQSLYGLIEFPDSLYLTKHHSKQLSLLKPGNPYQRAHVIEVGRRLSAIISEQGYPHVNVEPKIDFNTDSTRVNVSFSVSRGPAVKLGELYFTGNFRTRDSYLRREMPMVPGESFLLRRMLKAQQQIQGHDIFSSVKFKPIGLQYRSDDILLFLDVTERRPRYMIFGGGYNSEFAAFASLKVGHKNFMGMNKHLWSSGQFNRIGMSPLGYRFDIGVDEPRLFRTLTYGTMNTYHELRRGLNQNFSIRTSGVSLGLNRRLTKNTTTSLANGYELRQLEDVSISEKLKEDSLSIEDRPRNVILVTPSIMYDSRNSFIRPTKGWNILMAMDYSQGIGEHSEGDDYNKYRLEFKRYQPFLSNLTLALAFRIGFIHTREEQDRVPLDKLLYLGGTNTVRGFGENEMVTDAEGDPLGAERAFSLNAEFRWDIGMNLEVAAFFDAGQLSNSVYGEFVGLSRASAGGGLRLLTPIGPVGLLYGRKFEQRSDEKKPGAYHFSLGYTF